jgi:DNA-binding NarL/FixJ family response regulator
MATSTPLRIYLVEDSPILVSRLIEVLQNAGAQIVGHSSSAAIAIAEIDASRPDVVTVDIALQSGNGFDVLSALARRDVNDRPICVVLTNYVSAAYRNAAKRLGVKYFFDKSSEVFEMLKLLKSITMSDSSRNGSHI